MAAAHGVGRNLCAIAMTEPGTGSDLQGIRTRAVREGDEYVISGQKTFISNGQMCDLVIVVVQDRAGGRLARNESRSGRDRPARFSPRPEP